ncbi:MAG: GAF domain-containing protein, partial [Bacteroidota bacterium]
MGFYDFPFISKLSFLPLINHWKKRVNSRNAAEALLAQTIIKRLDGCLEFQTPIQDNELLTQHWDFVELLLTGILPLAYHESQLTLIVRPFTLNGFYQTSALRRLIEQSGMTLTINKEGALVRETMIIRACCMILNAFYGQTIRVNLPIIFTSQLKDRAVECHYKTELITDFVEIRKRRPLKPLTQKKINRLMANLKDLDQWLEAVPPENFEFHGLVRVNLVDVTEEEALSRLKRGLMERDAVVAIDNIRELEKQLQVYFNLPDLRLGITALDYPGKTRLPHRFQMRHDLLDKQQHDLLGRAFKGSIYEQACQLKAPLVIADLQQMALVGPLEQHLLEAGFRSLIIVPLMDQKQRIIGLFELGAYRPYELNNFVALKLEEVRPLFRTALHRSRVEVDNEIDAIIRSHYTSLHPSIEWKFKEASFDLLQRRAKEGPNAR